MLKNKSRCLWLLGIVVSFVWAGCDDSGGTKTDPCKDVTCSGNGVCVVQYDTAVCSCYLGYHADGLNCIPDVDPCEGITCSGHGDCVSNSQGDLSCNCDDGFHAQELYCLSDADPCLGVTCSGHGTCVNDGSGPITCACEEGYTDNGLECEEITAVACEGITCSEHGTCEVDLSGIPFCVCDDDYIAVNLECLQNDPGGDTVFMVQNPDETDFIPNGDFVILQLVTVIAKDTYGSRQGNFWVTEPAGGPWSSVQVYNADTTSTWWNQMQVGSVVNVHGLKMEYSYLDPYTNEPLFEDPLTEITEASVTVLGSGTPVGPVSINATDLLTIEAGEQWEGVLVSLQNVRVIRINENNGLHQYGLLGSINLVDDLTDLSSIQEGTCLSRVTGVVT